MKIICWTTQGDRGAKQPQPDNSRHGDGGHHPHDLLDFLEDWQPDVLIILEPPAWMKQLVDEGEATLERPKGRADGVDEDGEWNVQGLCSQGNSQGHMCVAYRKGSAVALNSVSVPGISQTNQLAVIQAEVDGEKFTIAASHSPRGGKEGGGSDAVAADYNSKVLNLLTAGDSAKGVVAGGVDVWLGDLNQETRIGTDRGTYATVFNETTTGVGVSDSPPRALDKIVVHKRLLKEIKSRGRIVPEGTADPTDASSSNYVNPKWKTRKDVGADHVPIMVVVGKHSKADPAASASSSSSEADTSTSRPVTRSVTKRKRDGDTTKRSRGKDPEGSDDSDDTATPVALDP
ncbi:MAG: hypothetical protein ACRC33_14085 [Gemmataceae bacterium]